MSDQESRLNEIKQLEEILAKRKLEYEKNFNITYSSVGDVGKLQIKAEIESRNESRN